MDQKTDNYLHYYSAQYGAGSLDVFRGARRGQFGDGLGDILRGIFRTMLPVAAHGATSFLGELAKEHSEGRSLKESAINALKPAAARMVGDVNKRMNRKRKRTIKQKGGSSKRRRQASHNLKPVKFEKVVKRKSYKSQTGKGKKRNKTINFLNF